MPNWNFGSVQLRCTDWSVNAVQFSSFGPYAPWNYKKQTRLTWVEYGIEKLCAVATDETDDIENCTAKTRVQLSQNSAYLDVLLIWWLQFVAYLKFSYSGCV